MKDKQKRFRSVAEVREYYLNDTRPPVWPELLRAARSERKAPAVLARQNSHGTADDRDQGKHT